MLPPKYIKTAKIHNGTDNPVRVKVCFSQDEQGDSVVEEELEILPNEFVVFDEKTANMGTWQAIVPVRSLHIINGNGEVVHHPKCDTIVNQREFKITNSINGLVFLDA